jgi:hypothetical protein
MSCTFKCLTCWQEAVFPYVVVVSFMFSIENCSPRHEQVQQKIDSVSFVLAFEVQEKMNRVFFIKIPKDVRMKNYFSFLDSLVARYDTLSIKLTEYAIVHANPRILDSLRGSDYYVQKKKGFFLYDQAEKIVIGKGDSLHIPDSAAIAFIDRKLKSTIIDLNIPEYTLRLTQLGDTILTCKVRVGQNQDKFLPIVGHVVDLRTPIGEGKIVEIEKIPIYRNPETGEKYEKTKRDDGRTTTMPIIPSLEPSIYKKRFGKVIHATTNPVSLGRASSHGCIGSTEADAWTIYYNSPIGTKVKFRYDLKVCDSHGDTILLKDIYLLH